MSAPLRVAPVPDAIAAVEPGRGREQEANGTRVGQLEPTPPDATRGDVDRDGELQRGVDDEESARAGAPHSILKWASVVRPVVPLIGRMSWGHAENATTRSISARNST